MKKTLVVFMVVVCVLAVSRNELGGAHYMVASQTTAFLDPFKTYNFVIGPDSSPSSSIASSAGKKEPSPKLPEPVTMMLFGLGLLSLATFKRRFKR